MWYKRELPNQINNRELDRLTAYVGHSYSDMNLVGQYENAVDILINQIIKEKHRVDTISHPLFYLMRHSIELGLLHLKITFYQKFLILKHMKQQEESMNKKESENQKRTLTLEERMKIRTYPSYFQGTLREIVENSTDSVEEAWEYLKDWESMM